MKYLLTLVILVISFFTSGCTYNLTRYDFEDENQFYSRINKVIGDRTVNIQTRDSTFEAEVIKFNRDSLKGIIRWDNYIEMYKISTTEKSFSFPNSQIKNIAVTRRSGGIAAGVGLGVLAGGALGWYLIDAGGSSNSGHHHEPALGAFMGIFPGIFLGGLIGWIVGDDYIFSFDDKLNRSELLHDNASHRYGFRLGYNKGFNSKIVQKEGYYYSHTSMKSSEVPGYAITLFNNYTLGKNFSLVNELSYISAGSEETNYVELPRKILEPPAFSQYKSEEDLKIIEMTALIRLNLAKEKFTPYLIMGPKFDLLFPGDSHKEKFFSDVSNQYESDQFSVSGKYNKTVWGAVMGAGLSTGKLFPYELLIELRYNFDITDRFEIASHFPFEMLYYPQEQEKKHNSSDWTINIGFALF